MLRVSGVRKTYGDLVALNGVDLDISPGEIVGLLGPNGAGKTTLVSIVAGLRRPDSGEVWVDGIDVRRQPKKACERLGLAPQDLGVYPVLTVRENLKVFGELAGLRGRELAHRIAQVAATFFLAPMLDRVVRTLSGGEKRRLHAAIPLLHRPPLLLLDEPTTGVDVRTRAEVLQAVRSLAAEGAAVCYSTHYLTEIETLGASVAILDAGVMIARGTLRELVAAHGTSGVELTFDGPAPSLRLEGAATPSDGVLWIESPDPAAASAAALAQLGDDTRRLRSVELVRPSLDSVFFALTGRRYEEQGDAPEEAGRDARS